eukprot:7271745-Heterocapsa_arctica.AAC.1
MLERAFEAQYLSQAQISAKLSAFCEEYNCDSKDARRPFENLRKQLKTLKHLQRHIHLYVYTCGAH